MTTKVLPKAADAAHLTDILRHSGALAGGRVCEVAVEHSRATVLSQITRLRLAYEGAAPDAPSHLFLKTALPERADDTWHGQQEVAFYSRVAVAMSARLVPRCFEASWDADSKAWHLLLEDLTDSHRLATAWPLPPTIAQCESIIRARARFHAAWWDDPRLGTTIGTWSDGDAITAYLQRFAERFERFVDRVGDDLPSERRELYERLLAAAPRLHARYHSHLNITVVQGDAHVWNCFLPRNDTGEDVRLFDWDGWRIDTATDDLAYMMAMHWYPDRRRQLERSLLDRYHAELEAHGFRGYDRRALTDDYRLSALWQIMTPVWQATVNIPPVIWWNNFERIFLAVDDLGCRDLIA
jgi:Ecdysteroid kinase-like family